MVELDTIDEIAEGILARDPGTDGRIHLLRDALQRPPHSPEVVQAREDLATSRRVQELQREQWNDGSWGRLHSQDSSAGQKIGATEVGVERALALGLDAAHSVLYKASRYLTGILEGRILCRDRAEKNDRWDTGVRLFSAATLAWIQPDLPVLDAVWELWMNLARRTFASGAYDPEAEIRAHRELTGASVQHSYLVLDSKYALALLGARAAALPRDLEAALLRWVWHKEDGIGYLEEKVSRLPGPGESGHFERWFASLELLSRFPVWRELASDVIRWFWDTRTPAGLWDFGPRSNLSIVLPLSESWRRQRARQVDWTTRVLVLLRRYYADDEGQALSL